MIETIIGAVLSEALPLLKDLVLVATGGGSVAEAVATARRSIADARAQDARLSAEMRDAWRKKRAELWGKDPAPPTPVPPSSTLPAPGPVPDPPETEPSGPPDAPDIYAKIEEEGEGW